MRSGWLQVRQVEDLQAEVLEVAVAAGLLDGLYDVEVVVDDGHAGKVLAHPLAVGVGHVHANASDVSPLFGMIFCDDSWNRK